MAEDDFRFVDDDDFEFVSDDDFEFHEPPPFLNFTAKTIMFNFTAKTGE